MPARMETKESEQNSQRDKGRTKEVANSFTRVGDSVVVHVRVWPGPQLDFSGPVPTWRDDERRS